MSSLISYATTGANALKNWYLMTRSDRTKLYIEIKFRFWPFHEMFMNHIKNMGWLTYLVFAESGTNYNIAKYFGQVKLEMIKTEYQALELLVSPNDNITKLKYCGLYPWLFNSSHESAQYFLSEEINNHPRSGPLSLRGVKQVISRSKKMVHTISLRKFDNNIK